MYIPVQPQRVLSNIWILLLLVLLLLTWGPPAAKASRISRKHSLGSGRVFKSRNQITPPPPPSPSAFSKFTNFMPKMKTVRMGTVHEGWQIVGGGNRVQRYWHEIETQFNRMNGVNQLRKSEIKSRLIFKIFQERYLSLSNFSLFRGPIFRRRGISRKPVEERGCPLYVKDSASLVSFTNLWHINIPWIKADNACSFLIHR